MGFAQDGKSLSRRFVRAWVGFGTANLWMQLGRSLLCFGSGGFQPGEAQGRRPKPSAWALRGKTPAFRRLFSGAALSLSGSMEVGERSPVGHSSEGTSDHLMFRTYTVIPASSIPLTRPTLSADSAHMPSIIPLPGYVTPRTLIPRMCQRTNGCVVFSQSSDTPRTATLIPDS